MESGSAGSSRSWGRVFVSERILNVWDFFGFKTSASEVILKPKNRYCIGKRPGLLF